MVGGGEWTERKSGGSGCSIRVGYTIVRPIGGIERGGIGRVGIGRLMG